MKQIEELQLSLHLLSKDTVGNYCMGAYDRSAAYANAISQLAAVVSAMLNALHDIDKNEEKLAAGGLVREERESIKKRLFQARQAFGRAEKKLGEVGPIVEKASRAAEVMDVERIARCYPKAPKQLREILTVSDKAMEEMEAAGMRGTVINLADLGANVPKGMTMN